jgi:predicted Zn-dependent peptidase
LAKETSRDQNAFCIESLFYTSFREHQLGQPKNGNRDAIKNITVNDLETHKENTFVGKNFAVVVTGEINHESVVATSDKWLNTL